MTDVAQSLDNILNRLVDNYQDIRKDVQTATDAIESLRKLRTRLADRSLIKHGAALNYGLDTPKGINAEAQSHAYANASMWLAEILDNTLASSTERVDNVQR